MWEKRPIKDSQNKFRRITDKLSTKANKKEWVIPLCPNKRNIFSETEEIKPPTGEEGMSMSGRTQNSNTNGLSFIRDNRITPNKKCVRNNTKIYGKAFI